ncbi:MAG TPA: NAD(P)-dependent alcohol dehydrogenase [Candidatus Baltobacteraceae bacterium]|nr:NAD(P)-dependent alcohol dehydrogenase [Candidatus Baltobacteraceae bacterium]
MALSQPSGTKPGARMKAVVQNEYGPPEVLRIEEVPRPVPRDGEVLIRIRASTVSQTDTHGRSAHPVIWRLFGGLRRPRHRTLGVELSGEVAALGPGVTRFHVGDAVFGTPQGFGAHAEYICLREGGALALKPANISFEEAAAVCDGAGQALSTLRVANVQAGQRIVIYGASGSLGTAAVQLAKELGAHVTGVCSTTHLELVRSLGADEVVDYTQDDFRKNGPFDAIIDAVGKYSFRKGRIALKPRGIYVGTDLGQDGLATLVMAVTTKWIGDKRLKMAIGRRSRQDVEHMKALIEAGKFHPVVDRTYPMEQAVEAHRYVEAWHKAGNVVLTMGGDAATRAGFLAEVGEAEAEHQAGDARSFDDVEQLIDQVH